MNSELLAKHIKQFLQKLRADPTLENEHLDQRQTRIAYYQGWTPDRIQKMTPEDLYEYLSQLWAMLIWGNKHYKIDKLIEDNTLEKIKDELTQLLYGEIDIEVRWNRFRKEIKGMGPALMSELLCHTFPNDFILWNRRAYIGLDYLSVNDLPEYDYQLTGKKYKYLSSIGKEIADALKQYGAADSTLLAVNYFLWEELQVIDNLSQFKKGKNIEEEERKIAQIDDQEAKAVAEFKHNDIRDKVAEIGTWLGFTTNIEKKIANGAVVDALWEATIGNMGRVIYVFEVQTNGSIDSLILNLLKASNNAAVQGLVAISDTKQFEKISKEVFHIPQLKDKLKFWDYAEVLQVHEQLAFSYSAINKLGLVPQGF